MMDEIDDDRDDTTDDTMDEAVPNPLEEGTPMGNSINPVEVQKYLTSLEYPAHKDDIIYTAERSGADRTVIDILRMLPEKEYISSTEVTRALGQERAPA